jgi:hypothetical protein
MYVKKIPSKQQPAKTDSPRRKRRKGEGCAGFAPLAHQISVIALDDFPES